MSAICLCPGPDPLRSGVPGAILVRHQLGISLMGVWTSSPPCTRRIPRVTDHLLHHWRGRSHMARAAALDTVELHAVAEPVLKAQTLSFPALVAEAAGRKRAGAHVLATVDGTVQRLDKAGLVVRAVERTSRCTSRTGQYLASTPPAVFPQPTQRAARHFPCRRAWQVRPAFSRAAGAHRRLRQ